MRTIYIDAEKKCHVVNDGNMMAFETDHFDGKCDVFVEGHCCVVNDNSVVTYPWKNFNELDAAQRKYEQQKLKEYEEALKVVGVTE